MIIYDNTYWIIKHYIFKTYHNYSQILMRNGLFERPSLVEPVDYIFFKIL